MTLRKAWLLGLLAVGLTLGGCSRAHIEAIELSLEADGQLRAGNVEGAIQKYEQATKLDPTNHVLFHKLAKAYEKREDWDKAAGALSGALQIAPDNGMYWFWRAYFIVQKAQTSERNPDFYEEAKEPLQKCIATDTNYAECYHFLGEAFLWTGNDQEALSNYYKAIEHDPTKGFFYVDPAQIMLAYQLHDQAKQFLKEGIKVLPTVESNREALFNMYKLLAQIAVFEGNQADQITAIEAAAELAGDQHPEIAFDLGSTYATKSPPEKEKAIQLLEKFTKGPSCKGPKAETFADQCTQANALIQRLQATGK